MYANAAIIAFFGLAAAQVHAPVGEPKGNPITRPLVEVVPKCEPFTITWTPTTANPVSLLLLKGPSSNVVKFGPALATNLVNGGSFVWTPAADLPVTDGPGGYGLQIIDDVTGQYQYSTQFGLSAGKCQGTQSSSVAPVSSSTPAPVVSSSAAGYAVSTPSASATPIAPSSSCYSSVAPYPTTMVPAPSGTPSYNSTVKPTGYPVSNTTTARLPEQTTNAASGLSAGLGLVGAAAAVAAFML